MTKALEVLRVLARDAEPHPGNLDKPDWSDCSQTWAAYVPEAVREVWSDLPAEAKLVAAILGEALVDRERFD
jgi:hypothetical protein